MEEDTFLKGKTMQELSVTTENYFEERQLTGVSFAGCQIKPTLWIGDPPTQSIGW